MSVEISRQIVDDTKQLIKSIDSQIDIANLTKRKLELETVTQKPDFWKDTSTATATQKELSEIDEDLNLHDKLTTYFTEIETYFELLGENNINTNEKEQIEKEIYRIIADVEKYSIDTFLSGKYDKGNAVITIKAGQGGTEAQDWTAIIYRMYTRYCNSQDWTVEIIDEIPGEAGFSTVIFKVIGKFAYGYLKKETGVHRLVRISPFNAQGLRQTSFAGVEVMPILDELDIKEIEIASEDITVDTMKSGGPGGQSVNTTNSAVRITHIPTGIAVKCSTHKSQIQNKESALQILKSKLYLLEQEKKEAEKETLRKDVKKADWGNQIRNYVLHPYKLVKDLRTGVESSNPDAILDGNLDDFIKEQVKLD